MKGGGGTSRPTNSGEDQNGEEKGLRKRPIPKRGDKRKKKRRNGKIGIKEGKAVSQKKKHRKDLRSAGAKDRKWKRKRRENLEEQNLETVGKRGL